MAKEEQRKSREAPVVPIAPVGAVPTSHDNDDLYQGPTSSTPAQQTTEQDTPDAASPTSPTSPTSSKGFKSLLSKLKRRSKHASGTDTDEQTKEKEPGFIGGAALRSSTSGPQSQSSKSHSQPQRESTEAHHPTNLGDVEPTYVPHVDEARYSDVSSLSSDGDEDIQARRGRSAERVVSATTATSGGTDFEEARDHFDADLAPPPTFTTDADKAGKGSPNRDSKFHEVGL